VSSLLCIEDSIGERSTDEYCIFSIILSVLAANSSVALNTVMSSRKADAPWWLKRDASRSENVGWRADRVEVMRVERVGAGSGKIDGMEDLSALSIDRKDA
jgi:hypothetical protein